MGEPCKHKALSEGIDRSIKCVTCQHIFVTPEARTKGWIEELIDVRKKLANDEMGETFELDFMTPTDKDINNQLSTLYGEDKKKRRTRTPAFVVKNDLKMEQTINPDTGNMHITVSGPMPSAAAVIEEPEDNCPVCSFALPKNHARCALCGAEVCDRQCLDSHNNVCEEFGKAAAVYGPLEMPPAPAELYSGRSIDMVIADDLVPAYVPLEIPKSEFIQAVEHIDALSQKDNGNHFFGPRDKDCKLCPLHARATNVCLPANGPANASILFIGGGANGFEDRYDEVFNGEEGARFNTLLERAELVRSDVRVTLATKCVTPSEREPNGKELRACSTHLMADIRQQQPGVIVLLGTTALKAVCGLTGITKERGKRLSMAEDFRTNLGLPRTYDPFVIATFGPGSTVHDPTGSKTATIVADFKIAAAQAAGTFTAIEVPWIWASASSFPTTGIIAADIETNGKELWDPDFRIRMISIDTGIDPVLVYRGRDVLAGIDFLHNLHGNGNIIVGHNWSAFDRVGIQKRVGPNLKGDDTQLIAHLLDETQRKKLEMLCIKHLNVAPWKEEVTWTWAVGPQTVEEWEKAGLYAARDSRYTRLLYLKLREKLFADVPLHNYYKQFFLPMSRALAAIEQQGAYASLAKIGEAIGEFALQKIRGEMKVRAASGVPEINPGSSKQMRELLFDKLQLPAQEWTDGDEPSSNESSLKRLRELVLSDTRYPQQVRDIVQGTLEYRESVKMLGTYLEPYALKMMNDKRLFFWYSVCQSVTRSSGDGQQIPRDKRIRRIITPSPGKWIVHADASQLELRIAAHLSGDENMLHAYRVGADLHTLTASKIYGIPVEQVTPTQRTTGKTGNFLLLYGAEEYTYEKLCLKEFDRVVPRSESTVIRDGFHNGYPRLQQWYKRVWDECSKTGVIRSLAGRKRGVPQIASPVAHEREAAFREAINFTDQDVAFVTAGLGLIALTGMGYVINQFVHDSYDIEIDQDESLVEQVRVDVKSLEVLVPKLLEQKFGIVLSVPLVFDVEVWK